MLDLFHVGPRVAALGLCAAHVVGVETSESWDAWTGVPAEPDFSPTTSCPIGYYQDSPIVFNCTGSGGEHDVKVFLSTEQEIGIPRGAADLKVVMQSDAFDGGLDIYDPIAGVWVKDHLRKQGDQWTGIYKHVHIALKTSIGAPTHEEVSFKGSLPSVLRLHLKTYNSPGGAEFRLRYSYEASAEPDCVKTEAVGCRKYDAFAARETTVQWSRWAREQYSSPEEAWTALASGHAVDDVVPAHRWCGLWNSWPAAPKQAADCEAVLKMVAGSTAQDGVTRAQFKWAYRLDEVANFQARCCSKVRMAYANGASAWSALEDPGSLWRTCEAVQRDQEEVSKHSWLSFVDVNGKKGIQAEEFHSCWMSAEECPRYRYYRTQVVLFHCRAEQTHVGLLLQPGDTQQVAEVPEGLLHLKVALEAEASNIEMVFRDAQAADTLYIVKPGSNGSEDSFQGASVQSRSENTDGILKESVTFKDVVPASLRLGLTNNEEAVAEVKVNYSYEGFSECPSSPEADEPDVPVGCAFYDTNTGIPQSCLDFSDFLQQAHLDADSFWASVQDAHVEETAVGSGIPFFLWLSLWTTWPGGVTGRHSEECFHWFDTNHDGYLLAQEVQQLYQYSRTNAVTAGYCGSLCHTYPNQKALWATWSDGGLTIAPHRWASLWNSGKPQVGAIESFYYMDKDGNGAIDHDEFQVCYNLGSCKHNWPLIGGILAGAGAAVGAAATAAGVALTHKHWLHKNGDAQAASGAWLPAVDAREAAATRANVPEDGLQAVAKDYTPGPSGVAAWIWVVASVLCGCVLIVIIGLSLVPFFVRKQTRPTRNRVQDDGSSLLERMRAPPPNWVHQMPANPGAAEPLPAEPTGLQWGVYNSDVPSQLSSQAAPVAFPTAVSNTVLRPIQPPPPSTLPVQPVVSPVTGPLTISA